MPVETDCKVCGKSIYLVAMVNGMPVWAHYEPQQTHQAEPADAIAEAFKDCQMIKPCPTCQQPHDPANECRMQRMTSGERLNMLADAQHGMTRDQRQNFEQLFIGALSVNADDESWKDCLATAARCVCGLV